jgi:hypothetical protein
VDANSQHKKNFLSRIALRQSISDLLIGYHIFRVDAPVFGGFLHFPLSGRTASPLPPHRTSPFFHAQNAPFLQIEIAVFLRIGVFFYNFEVLLKIFAKSLDRASSA